MQLIRCTGKLRKEMGLKDSDLFEGDLPYSGLGPWHANLIRINRWKCVLFTNDKTLFNFIAPDVRRPQLRELHQLFLSYLQPILAQEGFTGEQREAIAAKYTEVAYAKSNSKLVLGSMNDLTFHYEHRIMMAGGLHSPEVPEIISQLNHMPMGALECVFPIKALRRYLEGET